MVDFAGKFNTARTRRFDADTSQLRFESLADLYNNNGAEMIYILTGVYINTKSKYGEAPVFATPDFMVNIPSYLLATSKDIIADDAACAAINGGQVGFKIYTYRHERYNRVCFGVKFVNLI